MREKFNDDVHKILRAGVEAPSGDNLQQWRFEVTGTSISVYIPAFTKPPQLLERDCFSLYFSHGALIENIAIAADHFGYYADVTLFPEPSNPMYTARIELREDLIDHDLNLYSYIHKRRTNRLAHAKVPLTTEQKEVLSSVPARLELNARIAIVEDAVCIKTIAHALVTQVRMIFSHRELHSDFYSTLRFSAKSARRTRDGLDLRTLELAPHERFTLQFLMRPWPVVRFLRAFKFYNFVAYMESLRYRKSSAYLAIIAPTPTKPHEYVTAGRMTEHLWLLATKLGLAVQPTHATYMIADMLKDPGIAASFSPDQLKCIRESVAALNQAYGVKVGESTLFSMRVGTAVREVMHSHRRPLEVIFH